METINLPQLSIFEAPNLPNNPANLKKTKPTGSHSPKLFDPLENAFKEIIPQNIEENTVIKMRRMLGDKAKEMPDDQVQCLATKFQFLIDTWLDEFEKDVFSGMTLKEVLNEK
jgi:hypothetical protein